MAKDRNEAFLHAYSNLIRVFTADVAFVFDAAGITRLFWRFLWYQRDQDRHQCRHDRWQTKNPAPIFVRHNEAADDESAQDDWRDNTNPYLPELNHEAKDSGKGS